jgi:hypothetical protein
VLRNLKKKLTEEQQETSLDPEQTVSEPPGSSIA